MLRWSKGSWETQKGSRGAQYDKGGKKIDAYAPFFHDLTVNIAHTMKTFLAVNTFFKKDSTECKQLHDGVMSFSCQEYNSNAENGFTMNKKNGVT